MSERLGAQNCTVVDGDAVLQDAALDAIGQSVHRALDALVRQSAPSTERVEQVCRETAETGEAQAHLETIIDMTTAALASDTIARARSAEAFWTELYLAAPVEYEAVKVVDGLADLVYRDEFGIHIIDYKTDASIGDHNFPHYKEQLATYVELMRRATGDEHISASILHLGTGNASEVSIC